MRNQFTTPFLLGIDVGTTGCKTELLDVEGNTVARSYREYPLIYPRISWVEWLPPTRTRRRPRWSASAPKRSITAPRSTSCSVPRWMESCGQG